MGTRELTKPLYLARKWFTFVGIMFFVQAVFLVLMFLEYWLEVLQNYPWLFWASLVFAWGPYVVLGTLEGVLFDWLVVVLAQIVAGVFVCLSIFCFQIARSIDDAYSNQDNSAIVRVNLKIGTANRLLGIVLLIYMLLGFTLFFYWRTIFDVM